MASEAAQIREPHGKGTAGIKRRIARGHQVVTYPRAELEAFARRLKECLRHMDAAYCAYRPAAHSGPILPSPSAPHYSTAVEMLLVAR